MTSLIWGKGWGGALRVALHILFLFKKYTDKSRLLKADTPSLCHTHTHTLSLSLSLFHPFFWHTHSFSLTLPSFLLTFSFSLSLFSWYKNSNSVHHSSPDYLWFYVCETQMKWAKNLDPCAALPSLNTNMSTHSHTHTRNHTHAYTHVHQQQKRNKNLAISSFSLR